MRKVYIAAAFRQFSNRESSAQAYGEVVDSQYIGLLEGIEDVFLDYGFYTCLPHRDEGMWGKVYYEPEAISALCYRHVDTSDVVFAIAEGGRGVHLEIGYAVGLGKKKLIFMYNESSEPSTLIWGLIKGNSPWLPKNGSSHNTIIESYSSEADLTNKLRGILSAKYGTETTRLVAKKFKTGLIDIGSHTLKLKILSSQRGSQSRSIYEARDSLGIMKDVVKTGEFSSDTINALVDRLQAWTQLCREYSCDRIIAIGTAALRKAKNTESLLSRLKEQTSLEVEIMDPKRELRYVYSAINANFHSEPVLAVLNLGGGSIQVGVGNASLPNEELFLDFGTRHLIEKWPWDKPMTDSSYHELVQEVRERIHQAIAPGSIRADRLVHTGGELDFMLRCRLPMDVSRFSPTHVSEVPVETFAYFSDQFRKFDPSYIAKEYGLNPEWASGSVASNVIAQCIAEAVQAEAIIPSNLNVSDGIIIKSSSDLYIDGDTIIS